MISENIYMDLLVWRKYEIWRFDISTRVADGGVRVNEADNPNEPPLLALDL